MSPVAFDSGCVTIACTEVLVASLVVQHMPDGNEQLACHGHEDFHLVLPSDLCLMEEEAAEEAVHVAACSPCALYDGLAEVHVAVGYSARLDFPV